MQVQGTLSINGDLFLRVMGPFMAKLYVTQGPKMLNTLPSTDNLRQWLQVFSLTPLESKDEEKAVLRISTEKVEI